MRAENVKWKHSKIAFVTIPVLLLAATVAVSVIVSEEAFAKDGRYSGDTSQAAAVSNECLNPIFDSNTIDNAVGVGNCGGTVSQQDESGQSSAPITSQTANPDIELQRATTTSTQPPLTGTPPTVGACVGCFDMLSDTAQSEFEEAIPTRFQMLFPGITTIEQLCAALNSAFLNDEVEVVNSALDVLDSILNDFAEDGTINQATHSSIISCLTRLYG